MREKDRLTGCLGVIALGLALLFIYLLFKGLPT